MRWPQEIPSKTEACHRAWRDGKQPSYEAPFEHDLEPEGVFGLPSIGSRSSPEDDDDAGKARKANGHFRKNRKLIVHRSSYRVTDG